MKLFVSALHFVSTKMTGFIYRLTGVFLTLIQTKILLDVLLNLTRAPEPDLKYVGLVFVIMVANIIFKFQTCFNKKTVT